MIRWIAVAIAVLLAIIFVIFAISDMGDEWPPYHEWVSAFVLLAATAATLSVGDPRYLTAAYGFALGVLVTYAEPIFELASVSAHRERILGMDSNVFQMSVVLLLASIGIILALIAPGRTAGKKFMG